MKNSHVSSAKIFEDFPWVGEPWRFTCVSFGTALTTASKKGHFSCQNMLEVLVGCCQSVVSVVFCFEKRMAEINDIQNTLRKKQQDTHHCWKLMYIMFRKEPLIFFLMTFRRKVPLIFIHFCTMEALELQEAKENHT